MYTLTAIMEVKNGSYDMHTMRDVDRYWVDGYTIFRRTYFGSSSRCDSCNKKVCNSYIISKKDCRLELCEKCMPGSINSDFSSVMDRLIAAKIIKEL
jgi:hypothetical protein